ncbi:MAG: LOG family protein [Gammaproteobacteria bacterium]|jgi:predicted Rossmann-fold nucleotide-binding protein|nr:MAG: LOG family protein [Gammaproteobacteria bacterium]
MSAPRSASEQKVDITVGPRGSLELLSQREIEILTDTAGQTRLYELFRQCALAVLNTGSESDDAAAIFETYSDFTIAIGKRTRGLKLIIKNAPASAMVDGRMIEGVRQHLFAVLRDIVYIGTDISDSDLFDLDSSEGITDAVFHILKHARILDPDLPPRTVVCWGGHSISRQEYDYTKEVGYHLGLRGLDICTGCGPGAMKGPMKGAAVGHAKQRLKAGRYLGLSEPGIIAAEPPNPMVSNLVVLPDIEKRLEAFVRLGHGILVFPGGVGTAEEILYLLGILLEPANRHIALPLVFTGPPESKDYFEEMDAFLKLTFGDEISSRYRVIVGDAAEVGRYLGRAIRDVRRQRRRDGDAYYFNWLLDVHKDHQVPFEVNHENVGNLVLSRDLPAHELAVNLRRAFSAIVTGNVKDHGIRMIRQNGPFELRADASLVSALDHLLKQFVAQGRMKLSGEYEPCFVVRPVS